MPASDRAPLLSPTPPELILWDVMDQHLERAVFLYRQWQYALSSHRYLPDQVEDDLERRLAIHLEGLALGGSAVVDRLLFPGMEAPRDPDRATVAALVHLASGGRDAWYELFELLAYPESDDQRRGLARAAWLSDSPEAESLLLQAFEESRSPIQRAGLLDLLAARGVDPGEGLATCLESSLVPLRSAAIRAAGRAGRTDLLPGIEEALTASDPELGRAAVVAGLFLGSGSAWTRCVREASSSAHFLLLVGLLGGGQDVELIHVQLDHAELRDAALWALGFAGRAQSAEPCLALVESPSERTAKLAAEAFSAITGFEAHRDEPDRSPTPGDRGGSPPPPPADGLDADRMRQATDHLTRPRPRALVEWWEAHRDELREDERYLRGRPHTAAELVKALRSDSMRRRHGLALELALRTGARRLVSTDAFIARQRGQLEAISELSDDDFVNHFGRERGGVGS